VKAKELIRRLQDLDPSGEIEVTVGGHDIYFLDMDPGYYDGCYQVLIQDPELIGKSYSVIGIEIRAGGQKIDLHTMGYKDVLENDPDAPVTYDSDYAKRNYKSRVEAYRTDMKPLNTEEKK